MGRGNPPLSFLEGTMAKKALIVILDIEFPDGMVDDEDPGTPGGTRLAVSESELEKIIRDGCSENGFNYSRIGPATGIVHAELIYDLVKQ